MSASGLDTVSLAWRPASERFVDGLLAKPHRSGPGGARVFREPGPGNTKLIAFPGYGVVSIEGRCGAILSDRESDHTLCAPADVVHAEAVGRLAFGLLAGVELVGPAEVRRFDLAHEVRFVDGLDGVSFLKSCAGMTAPRRKTWLGINGGTVETVYFRQAKSNVVTERIYDKGVESGSHGRGQRIRIEAQRRPEKAKRYAPDVFAHLVDLGAEFGRSIIPQLAAEELVSAGTDAVNERLLQRAMSGGLTLAKAERLMGSAWVLSNYGRAAYADVQQQQRRLRELRSECGAVLDTVLPADRVVPVSQLLREAVAAF